MSKDKDGVDDTKDEDTGDEAANDDTEETKDDDTEKKGGPSGEESEEDAGKDKDGDGDDDFVPEGMDAEEFAELPESAREIIQSQEEDLVNYRVMAKNRKGSRSLPSEGDKAIPDEKKDKPKKPEEVSPSEFRKNNQQTAISVASADKDMPRLDENWDDVMGHYKSSGSDGTFQDYLSRITKAYSAWEKENPVKESKKTDTSGKRDTANAAADRSKPSPGKKKSPAKTRKRILKKGSDMSSWYGKKK